jgi:hypothetical protein
MIQSKMVQPGAGRYQEKWKKVEKKLERMIYREKKEGRSKKIFFLFRTVKYIIFQHHSYRNAK